MPESISHAGLVDSLREYIRVHILNGECGCMLYDSFGTDANSRPYEISGHIPDILAYPLRGTYKQIVGEAKTASDIENSHTHSQLTSFLTHCTCMERTLLVVAVPWTHSRLARNLLTRLSRKIGCSSEKWLVPTAFPG